MTHVYDQWYHNKKSTLLLQDGFIHFGPASRRRTLPWLKAKHKHAHQSKYFAFVQHKSNPSAYTFKAYRENANKVSKIMQKSRLHYETQHALKARTRPVSFLAHVRRNRHLKTNVIGLKDNEGETIFTPSTQAKLLKEFYSHMFWEDDDLTESHLKVPEKINIVQSAGVV